MVLNDHLIDRLAEGHRIDLNDAVILRRAARAARVFGSGLDFALGLREELPPDPAERRNELLREAFARFRVPGTRANASPARAFSERLRRVHYGHWRTWRRTGALPDDDLDAALVLAIELGHRASIPVVTLSRKQLTRILDTRMGYLSRFS